MSLGLFSCCRRHAAALVASLYVRTLRSANNLLSVVAGRLRRHAPHPVCAQRPAKPWRVTPSLTVGWQREPGGSHGLPRPTRCTGGSSLPRRQVLYSTAPAGSTPVSTQRHSSTNSRCAECGYSPGQSAPGTTDSAHSPAGIATTPTQSRSPWPECSGCPPCRSPAPASSRHVESTKDQKVTPTGPFSPVLLPMIVARGAASPLAPGA